MTLPDLLQSLNEGDMMRLVMSTIKVPSEDEERKEPAVMNVGTMMADVLSICSEPNKYKLRMERGMVKCNIGKDSDLTSKILANADCTNLVEREGSVNAAFKIIREVYLLMQFENISEVDLINLANKNHLI